MTDITNNIISAISLEIRRHFGNNYKIYKETVEQGFQEPCFLISSLSTNSRRTTKEIRSLNINFCIQYFPDTKTPKNQQKSNYNNVSEQLYSILELLEVDKKIKLVGYNMNANYIDDLLNFFVEFNINIYNIKKFEKMQILIERTGFNEY